ncbi:hypothetical protein ACLESO_16615, partial [Pyxidicoccus sp. 3LG]
AGETWLLLPGKGPHQVRLESPDGEALVRVELGVAEPPSAAPGRWWEQGSAGSSHFRGPRCRRAFRCCRKE